MGRRPLLTSEKVLAALQRCTANLGEAPSLEQLRRELKVGSTRTLFRYLRQLEDQGVIGRRPGAAGITLLKPKKVGIETRAVPIAGDIQAGALSLAAENVDGWLQLPTSMTGPAREKVFLLRVRGTSMNRATISGDAIEDGDLVLVKQQSTARNGDIVVALVDGDATLKRFVMAAGFVVLKPESTDARHHPIVVDKGIQIQGKAVRVLKKGSELLRILFE